jgi:hypothetical protein
VDPVKAVRFEACCRVLGLHGYEVFDQFLKEFLDKHWDQAQLDRFLPSDKLVTIHADRVNLIANRVNVLVVKQNMRKALKILKAYSTPRRGGIVQPKDLEDWKRRLHRSIQEAGRVAWEDRDDELRELVAQAEKYFQ